MAVADLITTAQDYAGTVTGDALRALSDATRLVMAVGYSIPDSPKVDLPKQPNAPRDMSPPDLAPINLDLPPDPQGAPGFQDISAIEAGAQPVLAATVPIIALPTSPAQLADFLLQAPGIDTGFTFPLPPDELLHPLITPPALIDRTAPSAPQVSLPVFGALAPVDNTVAPTDLEGSFAAAYRDAAPSTITMVNGYVDAMMAKYNPRFAEQMGRIEAQLASYLDGGTGFKPAVENAIYARARDKNDAEARRTRDAAYSDAASRGFTLPMGALMSAMQQARQSAADNNATAAREIVVLQAEMEQKNLQFAVTTSAGLRTALLSASLSYMQNLSSINGQALDYAKSVLGTIIEAYNIAAKVYGVKLDAYKAEAFVYETRLKSSMAGIELYQAEIKALESLTNVDRAKVDVYRARIESLRAYADVYKAQVDAVLGRASLEKLKLDLFQTQVQAYSAQVQGKNAEWQGYSAAIEGESAKVKMYGAQVDAFQAEVQGYKAGVEARGEVVRAQALTNQARAAQYSATLSGYSAVVTARGEKARTQLENQRQEIVAFQAQVQAAIGNAQVQNEYYKATSSVAISNAEMRLRAMVEGGNSQRAFGASIASLGTANAQIFGSLASSAMSGINSLAGELKYE
jgi:hypothetical protein